MPLGMRLGLLMPKRSCSVPDGTYCRSFIVYQPLTPMESFR